jgi:hypothetical protein
VNTLEGSGLVELGIVHLQRDLDPVGEAELDTFG